MTYVDYAYYQEVFQGELVPEEAFDRVAKRASRALDMLTYGRIDRVYAQCNDVRMACCAMCDELWTSREPEIQRERLDSYEVTFAPVDGVTLKKRLLDAARTYLWRTGLLSMAVRYA